MHVLLHFFYQFNQFCLRGTFDSTHLVLELDIGAMEVAQRSWSQDMSWWNSMDEEESVAVLTCGHVRLPAIMNV